MRSAVSEHSIRYSKNIYMATASKQTVMFCPNMDLSDAVKGIMYADAAWSRYSAAQQCCGPLPIANDIDNMSLYIG